MLASFRVSVAACTAAVAALGYAAGTLTRPDGLIERSFADALSHQSSSLPAASGAPSRLDPSYLHLSRLSDASQGPSLALGDRIKVATRSGVVVDYEIIELRPLALGAAEEGASSRLLLATAVSIGAGPVQTIRMVVEKASGTTADSAIVGSGGKPHAL